jgi:predicted aldo/keto reductase-like oxidoreductase
MQPRPPHDGLSRRSFIKAGLATAAAATLPASARADEPEDKPAEADQPKPQVPKRPLGKTGEKVSILNIGAGSRPRRKYLNIAYDYGIRYIDTAANYENGRSEAGIGKWMADTGRRKEMFIVTKVGPRTPDEWVGMIDARLENLQTDYVDLFFMHGLGTLGTDVYGEDGGLGRLTDKEWAAAADRLKKSRKVHFVGFTTHSEFPMRNDLLTAAAKGGWVDAVMMSYDPQTVRINAEFDKTLDVCHAAGIGLVCMKGMRAGVVHAPKFLPEFEKMGLTPHQAVLHGIWSDQRIASVCSEMPNLRIMEENIRAAAMFKNPLDGEGIGAVLELYKRYGRSCCNACDGSCRRAGKTKAALNEITRYLSYYEIDGKQEEARRLFAALTPEQRDWRGADLAAASAACHSKLDFAALLALAQEKLA